MESHLGCLGVCSGNFSFVAFLSADTIPTLTANWAYPGPLTWSPTVPTNLLKTSINGTDATWTGEYDSANYGSTSTSILNSGAVSATLAADDNSVSGAWCFVDSNASAVYSLNTSVNTAGYNVNEIDVYGAYNGGRCLPNVTVSYSLVGNPTSFTTIGTGTAAISDGVVTMAKDFMRVRARSRAWASKVSLRSSSRSVLKRTASSPISSWSRRARLQQAPSHQRCCCWQ